MFLFSLFFDSFYSFFLVSPDYRLFEFQKPTILLDQILLHEAILPFLHVLYLPIPSIFSPEFQHNRGSKISPLATHDFQMRIVPAKESNLRYLAMYYQLQSQAEVSHMQDYQ